MPANQFDVEVVSADKKLYTGEAVSLVAPGIDGYFGVLDGHAPMVAALKIGEISITPSGNRAPLLIAVAGGFVEVTPDHVVILADSAEMAHDIDIERARMAKERAEQRLRDIAENVDVERAQAALMRAINRLRTAEGQKGGQ